MTKDEIACRLIEAELSNPNKTVFLSNPFPKFWTTNPPPGMYIMVENALLIANWILNPEIKKQND